MRPVDLDKNLLMKALIKVVGDRRAHDVIDVLAENFGGMEVQGGIFSRKPIVINVNKLLKKTRLSEREISALWGILGGKKFYIPSWPYPTDNNNFHD